MRRRKINYVMCCWSGGRRLQDNRYIADPTYYLRKHLRILEKFHHNLDQITIVVAKNEREPTSYRTLLNSLPNKIQNSPVVLMERPNLGMSYGSFSDAYKEFRTKFDYYFYVEDDGIYLQHDFDKINLEYMEQDGKCGYLCGYVGSNGFPLHAAISTGLLRGSALEALWMTRKEIPHSKNNHYGQVEGISQIGISQALIKLNYTLKDWRGVYRSGFRTQSFRVAWDHPGYPSTGLPPILGPV